MQKFVGRNRLYIRDGYEPEPGFTIEDVKNVWNDVLTSIGVSDRMTAEVAGRTKPEKVEGGVLYINAGTTMKKRLMEKDAAMDISIILKGFLGKNVGVCIIS